MSDAGVKCNQQCERREGGRRRPAHRNLRGVEARLCQKPCNAKSGGEDGGGEEMQRDRALGGGRANARQRSARQHQHVRIAADRPFGEHDEDEQRRRADCACRRRRPPGDEQLSRDQDRERDHGAVGMVAIQHDHGGAQQIGGKRAGRDQFDLLFAHGRTEREAAYHQERRKRKSCDDMEEVRSDHRRPALQAW